MVIRRDFAVVCHLLLPFADSEIRHSEILTDINNICRYKHMSRYRHMDRYGLIYTIITDIKI